MPIAVDRTRQRTQPKNSGGSTDDSVSCAHSGPRGENAVAAAAHGCTWRPSTTESARHVGGCSATAMSLTPNLLTPRVLGLGGHIRSCFCGHSSDFGVGLSRGVVSALNLDQMSESPDRTARKRLQPIICLLWGPGVRQSLGQTETGDLPCPQKSNGLDQSACRLVLAQ